MTSPEESTPSPRTGFTLPRFRVWHLCLLTGFVAIAIANIQDQRRSEPFLIGLAILGFIAYALLAWASWRFANRFRPHVKSVTLLLLYLVAMAALFLIACVAYLVIEHAYVTR